MTSLLRPNLLSRTSALRAEFREAFPFPHLVFDDFLDPEFCAELAREFPAFDPGHATNELGGVGRKAVFPNVPELGPAYARFDAMMQSEEFLDWLGAVTGIPKLHYDAEYVGGGTHENLDGQELDAHVDFNYHPRTRLHRRLNLLLYLNEGWDPAWGGCLELQRDAWQPHEHERVLIAPNYNRCVVFETSEVSWHGFSKIHLPESQSHRSRRSIAVYFYTKNRPRMETAPNHGTVYVPLPLPEYFEPGHTLTPDDVHDLELLINRRDQQIRYLYEREKEFSRIAGSPSYRLACLLMRPLRILREAFRR